MAIIPGVMVLSLIFARRIRPIYRSVRKDVEIVDGRVGETFSGIRVGAGVPPGNPGSDQLHARPPHGASQELFAHRRELLLWTSWAVLEAGISAVIRLVRRYLEHRLAAARTVGEIMAFQSVHVPCS